MPVLTPKGIRAMGEVWALICSCEDAPLTTVEDWRRLAAALDLASAIVAARIIPDLDERYAP